MADLSGWQIAATSAALFLGATLQTSSGFGFALLALPLLGWIGVPGPLAITMSLAAMMLQGFWLLSRSPEPLRLRENAGNAAATVVTSVAGVVLLSLIWGTRPRLLGQLIGVLVVASVAAAVLLRPPPRAKVGAAWTAAAMALSGLLSGLSSIGGPPVALWAMAHDWSADRIRATIWLILLPRAPVLLVALYVSFGDLVFDALLLVLIGVPALWLGSTLGSFAGRRLTAERLRPFAMVILLLTGASAIVRPLLAA